MDKRYKLIITNRNLYKEIEINPEMSSFRLGTGLDCDFRLRKDLFFDSIELYFSRSGEDWAVLCSDGFYLSAGDVKKLLTKKLSHGDVLELRYQRSDITAFSLEFIIDFDNGSLRYDRTVDISSRDSVTLGSAGGADILLGSPYASGDSISLRKRGEQLILGIGSTGYGVYHNGRKARDGEVINSGDFFSLSDYFFYYKDGLLHTDSREDMRISSLSYSDGPDVGSYPRFNRNTRIRTLLNREKIEILDPPAKPQKPKGNIVTRLLPSMGMLLAAGVMAFIGGTTMIIFSGISGCMAILTTVLSLRDQNKEFKKSSAERIEKYGAYIDKKREEVSECRADELRTLEKMYVSQEEERRRLREFSPELFDRRPEDEDFLCVRLGTGDVESVRPVDYKKQERLETEDDLQDRPRQVWEDFRYIPGAPIVCDLKSTGAIGIVGEEAFRYEMMKNMVIDIAARQYHSDVELIFVVSGENRERIRWLRMLPHVCNDTLGSRNIVCDDESKNLIFEYLYKELSTRASGKTRGRSIVVFFYDEYGFKNHPISRFTDKARELGLSFVFFGDAGSDIPQGCGYIISIEDSENASLITTADSSLTSRFRYPFLSDADAEDIVELLAPVYTEELSLESGLTKNYSMFEMLNIIAVDDMDLQSRWASSQVYKSMAAPIGISKTGVVELDLHDKAHGPHGLVAGTTGSGKSEILQTYILAMSTLYHPYEVGFVIIDFKGGGMVNQFKELPHLMGAITNIDGKEINRSLKSIKAELQKRQRLFAEADVNHIDKYIRRYKAGEASVPLPHLIIIVDEFAELKAEQPEFMKELISAARIGRSLGVHLILATQKPSGQVNEQIWSNSRFKLCLKVQSQEDSNEVLKSPLAAEIKEPGRAYLQVGNNELFELFQSAYSGASEKQDDGDTREFTVCSVSDSGKRSPLYVKKKAAGEEGGRSQLDAIVSYVGSSFGAMGLPRLPDICLPPLGELIDFRSRRGGSGCLVDIGLYDDPENQYQGVYSIDIAANNLMIIGSSQSGKSNILQTMIRGIAENCSPEEANIYIIDFASMGLKNFEKLAHVGGVVCPSEDEKLKNLFKLLRGEIEQRKEKLMSVGVSSYAAYREAGEKELPLIVLMIDNLTALKELYFQDDDELLSLCREGLSVGISIVIANPQTAGIGYKYLSNFSARIALMCNDSGEYSALFDHCGERPSPVAGRCIVELEKRHLECQSYLAFRGEKEIDRVKEIRAFVTETNMRYSSSARRIPLIPAVLGRSFVLDQFDALMRGKGSIVAGLDYESVTPAVMDVTNLGMMALSGREQSGKHNWLRYAVELLREMHTGGVKLYTVDGVGKKLASFRDMPCTAGYSIIAEDAAAYVKEIEGQLKLRYDELLAGNEKVLEGSELLLLILDNPDACAAIGNDREALEAYKNIVGRYKRMNVCMLVLVENAAIPYSAPEVMKNLRDMRHVLFFDDLANLKLFDVPLSLARRFKKPIETGDAYYIRDSECLKLKTPRC